MRLAFSTIAPAHRCTQFAARERNDQDLSGSVDASATSTSPFGSTYSQRGCFSSRAKATTFRPAAALGILSAGQGRTEAHLMVGSQPGLDGLATCGEGP